MKQVELKVNERSDFGSPEARRMRREGLIPGVLYGGGKDSVPLSVDEKSLRQVLGHGHGNVLLNLVFKDKSKSHAAILKEYQSDPVTGSLLHLDFIEVSMDQPIDSTVHVVIVGNAIGLRDGGIMDHALRELHIRCLPNDIPQEIEIDVESLGIGDSARVSDIKPPKGVEILDDPEAMVAAVMAPKLVVEEVTEEGAEAAAAGAPAEEAGAAPAEGAEKAAEGEGGEG